MAHGWEFKRWRFQFSLQGDLNLCPLFVSLFKIFLSLPWRCTGGLHRKTLCRLWVSSNVFKVLWLFIFRICGHKKSGKNLTQCFQNKIFFSFPFIRWTNLNPFKTWWDLKLILVFPCRTFRQELLIKFLVLLHLNVQKGRFLFFFPLQKCSSLHEIFSGKLFCSGERSDQRERMSHVPSNAQTGVNTIPWEVEKPTSNPSLAQLGFVPPKKIPFCTPRVVNSWQFQCKYSPKPSSTCRGGTAVLWGKVQTGPFVSGCTPTFSICGKLIPWPHPSLASPGRFLGQLRDEVADPRCLDLPLASASLWRPLRFQINVQFGRVRVPPAARGCGDGIIILKKLLTSQSWKLWPGWKGKSL